MANTCFFQINLLEGRIEDFITLFEYLEGNKDRKLLGCYTDTTALIKENNPHALIAYINGGCRWSVNSSFLENGYYKNYKEKDKATNLEELTKELNLKISVLGEEFGFDLYEYYAIDKGKIIHEVVE